MIQLSPLFSDGAVLQARKPIRVFGRGTGSVTVRFHGETVTAEARDGMWEAVFAPRGYQEPEDLFLSDADSAVTVRDVSVGEVLLLSGQSNIEFRMRECTFPREEWQADPRLHFLFSAPKDGWQYTGWVSCTLDSMREFSAIGYHLGERLIAERGCHVGLITAYQGASVIESWMPRALSEKPAYVLPKEELHNDHFSPKYAVFNPPAYLYNLRILPLFPYSIGAVIWYQGESNTGHGEYRVYGGLMKELISCWRDGFRDAELPFVLIQLADFPERGEPWEKIREVQRALPAEVPGVFSVACGDVCEKSLIHPPTKIHLSNRLAQVLLENIL